MAKRIISVNLEEDVIAGIDELAELMGVSRSRVIEMTLKTAVGGQSVTQFSSWLFSSLEQKKGGRDNSEKQPVTA